MFAELTDPRPYLKEKVLLVGRAEDSRRKDKIQTGGVGVQTWTAEEMKAHNDGLITTIKVVKRWSASNLERKVRNMYNGTWSRKASASRC